MNLIVPVINVGGRDVVASGAVVLAPGEELEIGPLPGVESALRVRIVFERQDASSYKMEGKQDGDLLTIRLFNFNNPIGIAPLQPVQIGKVGDRILLMSYIVHAVGSDKAATRLFSYTISSKAASKPVAEAAAR
jgi:hypothetical protein